MIGTTISHFRILDLLGKGGMGEVYRAEDTTLDRQVAIKVLPELLAHDPERLARFEREAKLLATLNHPNIAAIYGLEEADGKRLLILELVEGETLAEKIKKGTIPVEEALRLALQITEGLEAAHEKGILHRDLKPANVKITPEGKVKILDFGLAKAFEDETAATDASHSPTLTEQMTQAGVILGTAAYMSPEQASGQATDKRSDIWSFGVVFFEMLTVQQLFSGDTVSHVLASVLKTEPDWSLLPKNVPILLRRLLRRCLEKDRKQRLHDIADARIEIDDALKEPATSGGTAAMKVESPAVGRSFPGRVALVLSGVLLGAVLAGLAVWSLTRPTPLPVKRFAIQLPPGDEFIGDYGAVSISPDGQNLVYVAARRGGSPQLYLRPIDQLETSPLPGSEEANSPFFSWDSQWVGFVAGGVLKKVSVTGGSPITISSVGPIFGASWGLDDTIYFSRGSGSEFYRISASGGEPEAVRGLGPEETNQVRWPKILPGGKAVLYSDWRGAANSSIFVHSLETGERRTLLENGSNPHYVPTGHIVYQTTNALMGIPFDLDQLQVSGSPALVLEDVGRDLVVSDGGQFSLSRDGSLIYVPGSLSGSNSELVWVDRQGTEQPLVEGFRAYLDPRLSPDGQRLVFSIFDANGFDVWVFTLGRGILSRLTFGDTSVRPLWSPDGQRVIFASNRGGGSFNIFSKPADGSAAAEQLTSGAYRIPTSVSSDGKTIVFRQNSNTTGRDIGMIRLEGESEPEMLLETPFEEHTGMLSPDDRWLAYVSNESGREEIYVRPFKAPGGKWQVSTDGGTEPLWSRDGRELFYQNGAKMMAVAITTEPEFTPGSPALLFEGRYVSGQSGGNPATNYDVAADGRFVMLRLDEIPGATQQINVVLNWFEELKRLVPTN